MHKCSKCGHIEDINKIVVPVRNESNRYIVELGDKINEIIDVINNIKNYLNSN